MSRIGELELIRESLIAVVHEMRANVIRSSYSSIIYEGHDFSCALVAADGRLVAQGVDDNPIHIFAVPYSTAEVVAHFGDDIHDGDIFLHNDPYTGGTHLNDVLMLYPIFCEGRLALFAATRCHWGDVGGMTPGSLSGRVREVYQEGLRIEPTRICDRGRMNEAFLSLLFNNMRIPDERRGDFSTMLGTSRKAAEHVQRLFQRFGPQRLLDAVESLITRAEGVMRQRIAEAPDGEYLAEGYLDNDGHGDEPLYARLQLRIDGERLIADFSGTSAQCQGPTNVGPAMALNAVASIAKSFLDPHTPVNHGAFNPLEVINPPGSFLNAVLPAPCGGMVECRALMCGLMVCALGKAVPQCLVGDLKGGANHVYVSGRRPESGELFLLYEYPAGGTGASAGGDGNNGVRAFPEGDFNTVQSVEVVEAQSPLRVLAYGLRDGSCGDGEHRGGLGLRREIQLLCDAGELSVLADKNVIPPFGVAGGGSGSANRFSVIRDGERIAPSTVPGKVGGFALRRGDVVCMETSGGGGHGDPLLRDPERVAAEVRLAYLSTDQARQRYGVVLDGQGSVEHAASEALRARMRQRRHPLTIREAGEDRFHGTRRVVPLSHAAADAFGLRDGELVELDAPGAAAPLRGWVRIGDESSSARLGPLARAILGLEPGEQVRLRRLEDRT
jgi:N-methylhydantoinase B